MTTAHLSCNEAQVSIAVPSQYDGEFLRLDLDGRPLAVVDARRKSGQYPYRLPNWVGDGGAHSLTISVLAGQRLTETAIPPFIATPTIDDAYAALGASLIGGSRWAFWFFEHERLVIETHFNAIAAIARPNEDWRTARLAFLENFLRSHPDSRSGMQVAAAWLVEIGAFDQAREILRRLSRVSLDPFEERLLIDINARLDGSPDYATYRRALAGRFCEMPFTNLQIEGQGSAYLCCSGWLPVNIGPIEGRTPADVFNAPIAEAIRQSIHDGSFAYCGHIRCPRIAATIAHVVEGTPATADVLPLKTAVTDPGMAAVVAARTTRIAAPETLVYGYDHSCNLSCPSCRNDIFVASRNDWARYDQFDRDFVRPLLPGIRQIDFGISGDTFASRHYRGILKDLSPETYPNLEVSIMTNGVLFKKFWPEMTGLHRMPIVMSVSIDAATPATYATLRRGGDWAALNDSLELMAELRRTGNFRHLSLNFVVQQANFREMPAFAAWAERLGADAVVFQRFISFGNMTPEQLADADILDPGHPRHQSLQQVLKDAALSSPIATFNFPREARSAG